MKKQIMIVAALSLLLGAGAGTAYAYLTGQDRVVNMFQASKTEIEIEEAFEPVPDPKPGSVIKKAPRAVSASSTDCYVRMMVRFSDSAGEACCEPLSVNRGWSLGEDGYYYWYEKVQPGGATGTLFDAVKIRTDVKAEEIPHFDILVYAEAVQSADREMKEAWAAMDRAEK